MANNILITLCMPFIVFLLGFIAYFLKKHLENFEELQHKVEKHEIRITILETNKTHQ